MRIIAVPFTVGGNLNGSEQFIVGMSSTGFTRVRIYNGNSTGGDLIINAGTDETIVMSHHLWAPDGVYIDTQGTGKGTLWLVGMEGLPIVYLDQFPSTFIDTFGVPA